MSRLTRIVDNIPVDAATSVISAAANIEGFTVRAEAAAASAEAAAGPNYPSIAAGLAATTNGQSFAVNAGSVITVYLNNSGAAVPQRTWNTANSLAAPTGAALVGHGAGTVADAIAAIPAQISTIVLGASYYDVQQRHSLDGGAGDRAKIQAAHDAAPVGTTLVFPPVSSPITSTLNFTRNLSFLFNGTTWRFDMANNNTDGINYSPTPADGFIETRQKTFEGLTYFFVGSGRHGINFTTGVGGGGALGNVFSRIIGSAGPNPAGYALRMAGAGPHWNEFNTCLFQIRGVYDESADGNKFVNCGFAGQMGVALNKVSGAFKNRILNSYFAMGGICILNLQGEAIDIEGNSFEHDSAFVAPKMPYDGTTDCNFPASIVLYNVIQNGMRDFLIEKNNFGGGRWITNSILMSGASPTLAIHSPIIDKNFFNICAPLTDPLNPATAVINPDVNIIGANVLFTRFGDMNVPRGDRTALPDPNNAPFYINNNGVGTYGVWTYATPLSLQNGWTAGNGFAWRKNNAGRIEFRGTFVAGTKTADTLIGTMPEWSRPYADEHFTSYGAATGAVSGIVVKANGEIRVGPVAFDTGETQLQMGRVSYAAIAQTSVAVGV
jgi:hypothetical protein